VGAGVGADRPTLAAALAAGVGLGAGLLAAGFVCLRRDDSARSRRELQDSEALFRNLFEASPFPAAVSRLDDHTVMAVNQCLTATFGVPQHEAIGARARDYYVNPEDRDRLVAAVQEAGRADETLVQLRTPGGAPFWAAISARRVTYRNVPAMLAVFHDVDSRIRLEQALKASEQRLAAESEALTELTATGASVEVGFDGRLRRILEACAKTLAVERVSVWRFDEDRAAIRCVDLFESARANHTSGARIERQGHVAYFEAMEAQRLIAADDAHTDPRTREFLEHYLRPNGIGAMLDVPLRQDDQTVGVLCLEHVGAKRFWTHDEQNFALSVANLVAAATADEERRAALRQLAESESRARLVVDTAPDAFVGIDSAGLIVAWNTQAQRTFGWSRDEVLGRQIADTIIPPAYRSAHLQGMRRFFETGEAPVVDQRLELTALHRDGNEFPVELAVTQPIRRDAGLFFGAFLRDISERRRREAELRHATEVAEAATRAKSEFLANMSHELRTPLNGVLGYAQLLRRDRSLAPDHHEAVEGIAKCGAHLLDLINQVLDLSRIEAGRVEQETVVTELAQLVTDVRLLTAEPARKKGLRLEVALAPDLPSRVLLDGRHLRQILINLLGNAVKFTERGGVRLEIARQGPDRLRFDVVDTGVGIEPEGMEVIFEAFGQTRSGAIAGGTGLGLTISQRLVRAMGGELRVESTLGQGSRFWFSVPLVSGDRSGDGAAASIDFGPALDLRLAPGQEVTVLIVDDSSINRRIMAGLLEGAGIRTLTAAAGAEGVAMAREHRPDVIIMDIRMSGMDGIEATRHLMSQAATAAIPVLAVTASPDEATRAAALKAGCRDFLPKPLRAADLFERLARHLRIRFEANRPAATAEPIAARMDHTLAERLRQAATLGSVSDLQAIAQELLSGDEAGARLGRRISQLTSDFDFEAVQRLASEGDARDGDAGA
jgi:PAS domain S-box-containing protein